MDEIRPRIGVLGGSFNPPTVGHMQMGLEVINRGLIDELWIVPCGDRIDKPGLIKGSHRLEMVTLLVDEYFKGDFPVKVNDIEIKNGKTIPTDTLLDEFTQKNPKMDFFFILGSDLLPGLRSWDNGDVLVKKYNFLIYSRIGYELQKEFLPTNYIILQTTFVGASSTLARQRISEIRKREKNQEKDSDADDFKPKASSSSFLTKHKTKGQIDLENKWLNVYGILSFGTINYIKDNKLYI